MVQFFWIILAKSALGRISSSLSCLLSSRSPYTNHSINLKRLVPLLIFPRLWMKAAILGVPYKVLNVASVYSYLSALFSHFPNSQALDITGILLKPWVCPYSLPPQDTLTGSTCVWIHFFPLCGVTPTYAIATNLNVSSHVLGRLLQASDEIKDTSYSL